MKPCITPGCPRVGAPASKGGARCTPCEKGRNAARNAEPARQAYKDPAYQSIPLGGVCWVCGEGGADTRDHVVPLAKGGTNEPSNIRPAHRACNSSKGSKTE